MLWCILVVWELWWRSEYQPLMQHSLPWLPRSAWVVSLGITLSGESPLPFIPLLCQWPTPFRVSRPSVVYFKWVVAYYHLIQPNPWQLALHSSPPSISWVASLLPKGCSICSRDPVSKPRSNQSKELIFDWLDLFFFFSRSSRIHLLVRNSSFGLPWWLWLGSLYGVSWNPSNGLSCLFLVLYRCFGWSQLPILIALR